MESKNELRGFNKAYRWLYIYRVLGGEKVHTVQASARGRIKFPILSNWVVMLDTTDMAFPAGKMFCCS